jgi:hypothetical protein
MELKGLIVLSLVNNSLDLVFLLINHNLVNPHNRKYVNSVYINVYVL